jgi:predicted DNA-binding transcriptional regulator AlpA
VSRRALWLPSSSPHSGAADPGVERAPPPPFFVAPDGSLRGGGAIDAQVNLVRLADVLGELADTLRLIARESLAVPRQEALMCPVENTSTSQRLLSTRDVAQRLALSDRTVRRLRKRGALPRGIEVAGVLRWRPEEIDDWITRGGRP